MISFVLFYEHNPEGGGGGSFLEGRGDPQKRTANPAFRAVLKTSMPTDSMAGRARNG